MYTNEVRWHTEHYGAPDKFGYKDFIPLFKAEKFDPAAWAALFRQSGAAWRVNGEGPSVPAEAPADWRGGSSAAPTQLPPKRLPGYTSQDYRYTSCKGALYALGMGAPGPGGYITVCGKG